MKIVWLVSTLEQKGGGERFVLEGSLALRALGHQVTVVCDRVHADASFDGRYDLSEVVSTERHAISGGHYALRALNKLRAAWALFGILRGLSPDLVICQSEFDAIRLFLVSRLKRFPYRVFVFGQMYQFSTDISRYSSVFRRHLETIVASRPGYRDTVAMPPPKLGLLTTCANEVVSRLKYRALRAADRVFTLSNQVRWEVSLIYGRDAAVCRAAFDASYIDARRVANPAPVGQTLRILSVCRLVEKKRVALTIAAFSASSLKGRLFIVGTGSDEQRLKDLAASSPRRDDICFLGAIDDAQLQREIAAADCFVSMDVGDFDISVVEAMGKGLRVIVPTDFDMSEFGAEFSGVSVVAPDVQTLARAIEAIPAMSQPTEANIPALHRLTWQSMAQTCVTGISSPR